MLKGAIHIHSTYSDGEFTLAQLREVYAALGCDFVCMTDHAEYFDAAKNKSYIDECRSLSDDRFRFITGLEYTCDNRMHVLAYGVTSPVTTTDPQKVIRHIKNEGGISVIAHPMDSAFEWIESFEELPMASRSGTQNTMVVTRRDPARFAFSLVCKRVSLKCAPSTGKTCTGRNNIAGCSTSRSAKRLRAKKY